MAARPARIRTSLPVRVTRPDKVFWPDEGYTKLDLIRFYDAIFPHLRPFVKDRLLTLERCPDGMRGRCFYQREAPRELPPGTATRRVRDARGVTNYVVGGRRATQLELVNLGCIAVHVWNSRAGSLDRPDWVCFDLDPASGRFADAARAGRRVKEALDALGLASYPKTSGSRGLHVLVPIRLGPSTADVLAFAETLARRIAAAHPRELTTEARVAARRGRVYIDPFRNGFAQSVVAPFSVRRRPRAPVSTPLDWSEVSPRLVPAAFNIKTVLRRAERAGPWQDFFRRRQALGPALEAVRREA
jgi:bifunctional non-homologous end joining protein LigD